MDAEKLMMQKRIDNLQEHIDHLHGVITDYERENARLKAELETVKRERNAAILDMKEYTHCGYCKHQNKNIVKCTEFDFCCDKCDAVGCECVSCDEIEHQNWQWRGLQENGGAEDA